jgi:mannose-6-phosphate isomerase-like protein (cupin superfamily)
LFFSGGTRPASCRAIKVGDCEITAPSAVILPRAPHWTTAFERSLEARILNLRNDPGLLGVSREEAAQALERAVPDPKTGISHEVIKGDSSLRFHAALIPQQVNAHYHLVGPEDYSVLSGSGVMLFGKVESDGAAGVLVKKWLELPVSAGDSFTIPAGYAHQLCRVGEESLAIVFSCPDSHLGDDRYFIDNSPLLAKHRSSSQG